MSKIYTRSYFEPGQYVGCEGGEFFISSGTDKTPLARDQAEEICRRSVRTISDLKLYGEWFVNFIYEPDEFSRCHNRKSKLILPYARIIDNVVYCPYRDQRIWKGKHFSIFKVNRFQLVQDFHPFLYIFCYTGDERECRFIPEGSKLGIEFHSGSIFLNVPGCHPELAENIDEDYDIFPF